MHSGDNPKQPGNMQPKSAAEVEAVLKKASSVISANLTKRMENAMIDVVDVILTSKVNQALAGEYVFAGATHPNVPKKPPKGKNDENDYVSYLYSDAFVPSQALMDQKNIGRIVGWLKTSLDENTIMVGKWISLLEDIENVTAKEDVDQVRTAIVFYCCSRMVEGEYLREDAALNKELADSYSDYSESAKLSPRLRRTLDELQKSELVIKNGAFEDKDSIISIVISKFQQHETERMRGEPNPSFGLPAPVIRLLVYQINHLINDLTRMRPKAGLIAGLFSKPVQSQARKDELIDKIYLLSCLLESKDKDTLIATYQNNQGRYDKMDSKSKASVAAVIDYLQPRLEHEPKSRTPSPRGTSSE